MNEEKVRLEPQCLNLCFWFHLEFVLNASPFCASCQVGSADSLGVCAS